MFANMLDRGPVSIENYTILFITIFLNNCYIRIFKKERVFFCFIHIKSPHVGIKHSLRTHF